MNGIRKVLYFQKSCSVISISIFRNIKESPHLNHIQLDTYPYKLKGEGASIDNCFLYNDQLCLSFLENNLVLKN